MFEISFPGTSTADAGSLAKKLRLSLVQGGVSDRDIRIVKERPDTMELGSTLEIVFIAAHTLAFAKAIWEICAPAKSGVRIKLPDGKKVDLKAHEIDLDRLKTILTSVSTAGAASKPKE